MPLELFRVYECCDPACRFRFPAPHEYGQLTTCPRCASALRVVQSEFSNHTPQSYSSAASAPVVDALLDNIRSTFNVGAMFRTADGAGLRRLHLAGTTPTPEHPKIVKTGLGAEWAVNWTYHSNALEAAQECKRAGFRLWAVEAAPQAQSLYSVNPLSAPEPILMIMGNETSGVDPAILDICDAVLWIPMSGYKRSLNVAVAFGIAAYHLRFGNSPR